MPFDTLALPEDAGRILNKLFVNSMVDKDTFSRFLELDKPNEHDFSASIVFDFLDLAEDSFYQMDKALEHKVLIQLAWLGDWLKGSSARLGVIKVRDGCEKIEKYGTGIDEDGTTRLGSDICLERISENLKIVKGDYKDVKTSLKEFYSRFGL
ncbi:histidine-phosphotransfer domain, HPT domain-containing protein [Aspergillus minisclerotigenes]|uniref:Histidine-phosphotransfer domain, HPT domain-containing protein n=1 Tax=Aspergillus minisclerotigenes TaxID=656917 RepID=A0A5N6JB01_9EURO|nr:histidine-phosphotransfer domain, HPT domain-containing protein [Aspergillus minisclerotigenes]